MVKLFTALHGMQTRSSDENFVCLCIVHCDRTEEKSVVTFIPCGSSFSPVFWEEEWLVVGDPFYMKFLVNQPPLEQNRRFWTDIRS